METDQSEPGSSPRPSPSPRPLTFPPSDPQVRGPADQLRALLHPQGPLRARAPVGPLLRLGHGHRAALVGRPELRGGAPVGQNQVDPRHQHADVTGAEAAGDLGRVQLLRYGLKFTEASVC